jgi:hypothetical protein
MQHVAKPTKTDQISPMTYRPSCKPGILSQVKKFSGFLVKAEDLIPDLQNLLVDTTVGNIKPANTPYHVPV